MSKNEKVKAEIDYLKAIIIFLLTALFAIVGWIVTIRTKAEAIDIILVSVGIIGLSVLIFLLNKKIHKKFKELGDLKERK